MGRRTLQKYDAWGIARSEGTRTNVALFEWRESNGKLGSDEINPASGDETNYDLLQHRAAPRLGDWAVHGNAPNALVSSGTEKQIGGRRAAVGQSTGGGVLFGFWGAIGHCNYRAACSPGRAGCVLFELSVM